MLTRWFNCRARYWASVALLVALSGCSKEQTSTTTTSTDEGAKPALGEAQTQTDMEALLAKADSFDGEADKIVARCASCSLGMDGKSDHAVKVLDYTLHFCSERCAQTFAEDTTKSVLAMKIPEK